MAKIEKTEAKTKPTELKKVTPPADKKAVPLKKVEPSATKKAVPLKKAETTVSVKKASSVSPVKPATSSAKPAVVKTAAKPAAKPVADKPAKSVAAKTAAKPAATKPAKPVAEKTAAKPVADKPVTDKKAAPAETDTAAKKKDYHISQRAEDGMWQVKGEKGAKALKLFRTQAEAIEFAKKTAENQEGNITIHKKDGKIRKQKY